MGYFLMFIAAAIAGVAAYFSVYGLAHIFAATFWSVVLMGGILEIGKLVATSFLYRYWDHLKFALKAYLFVAIIGLMMLTSAGIFGYLSNAYQQDIVGVKDISAQIESIDVELAALVSREQQINDDIGRIGSNYVSARQNMIKQYAPEKNEIVKRVAEIRIEQRLLSTKQLEVEAHTGPIIYIAKAMDKGVDDAVLWMICLIIFVFDPLAVALTIGANIAWTTKLNPTQLEEVKASDPPPIPDGMVLVNSTDYHTLRGAILEAADEMELMEAEIATKQDSIEEMVTDHERLEDELFQLYESFKKKDLVISQLQDAVTALEATKPHLTIQERAALHHKNQIESKTT